MIIPFNLVNTCLLSTSCYSVLGSVERFKYIERKKKPNLVFAPKESIDIYSSDYNKDEISSSRKVEITSYESYLCGASRKTSWWRQQLRLEGWMSSLAGEAWQ